MKSIVGAGLAGLIAAHAWPNIPIFEAAQQPREEHKALLRFRSEAVGQLVGVEFRKVKVHKGIYSDGCFRKPTIRTANLYSRKVLGSGLKSRSIWDISDSERFIAPENLYEQLVDYAGRRIEWGTPFDFGFAEDPVVSTAPMPVVLKSLDVEHNLKFERTAIYTHRWKLPNSDVFQTVYYPDHFTSLYRVSITSDLLIAESMEPLDEADELLIELAFGISLQDAEPLGEVKQKYGKISPVPDQERKQLLFKLTHEHGIYSLGRFATYRNILLDDVVHDISVIKRLGKMHSAYDLSKH